MAVEIGLQSWVEHAFLVLDHTTVEPSLKILRIEIAACW